MNEGDVMTDDQHLKLDPRSTREGPRYQAKSKHEDRNQVRRKIVKKRAHRGDRTLAESDRMLRSRGSATAGAIGRWRQIDRMRDCSVRSSTERFPERRNYDRTRPVACDRTPSTSDQLIAALTVGTTGRIRSGRPERPVSSRKVGFRPQRLLSQWGL